MDPKGIGAALISGIPIIGSLASAALQRHWAQKDLAAQNKYNSPAEQLRRLKQAGLPAASFFSGGVSSQSEQPRSTNVNPDLGTSEVFSKFTINALEKKQLQIMDAEIMQRRAEAKLKDAEAEWWLQDQPDNLGGFTKPIWDKFSAQRQEQDLDNRLKKVLTDIQEKYGDKLTAQQLATAVQNYDIGKQLFEDNQQFMEFRKKFQEALDKARLIPDFNKGIKENIFDSVSNMMELIKGLIGTIGMGQLKVNSPFIK